MFLFNQSVKILFAAFLFVLQRPVCCALLQSFLNYLFVCSFLLYSVFNEHFFDLALLPRLWSLVGSSGLAPPTSRLSGARSNHLSYEPIFVSRTGPFVRFLFSLVEMKGIEPLTPCLQGRCSPS